MGGRVVFALVLAGCAPASVAPAPSAASATSPAAPPTPAASEAPPAPPPSPSTTPPSTEQSITRFRDRIRRCWMTALDADPDVTLAIDIDLHVAVDGSVTKITSRPRGQTPRNAGLVACIEENARKVVFAPRETPTTVTVPLILTRK